MPLIAEADVVDDAVELVGRDDLPDRLLDPVGKLGRLLDPGAGLRAHMHLDLPAIDAREEVLAQERHQDEGGRDEAPESRRSASSRCAGRAQGQQAAVAAADSLEPALEAALEAHQADCGWAGTRGSEPAVVAVPMHWLRSR